MRRRIKLTLFYSVTVFYPPSANPCSKSHTDCCATTVGTVICRFSLQGQQNKELKPRNRSSFLTRLEASRAKAHTRAGNEWGDVRTGSSDGQSARAAPAEARTFRPHSADTLATARGLGSGGGGLQKQQLGPQGASSSKDSDGIVNGHVFWKQKLYNCQSQTPEMQGPQPNPSTKTQREEMEEKEKEEKEGDGKGEEEEKREVRRKIGERKWGAARGRGRREQYRQGQELLQR